MSGENLIEDDISLSCFFKIFEFHESGAIMMSNPVLQVHPMNPVPAVSQQKHKCEQCSYSTNNSSNLTKHLSTHSGQRYFSCSLCESTYTQLRDLHGHEERMHMKEHHCLNPTCGESFENEETLKAHQCRHRVGQLKTESERKHKCEQCSFSTINIVDLKRHRRTHTGEKPHQCPHCAEAFAQNGTLHRHLRVHSGERLFSCRICEAPFSHLRSLHLHERRIHYESPTERKHKCEQCSYSTDHTGHFRIHRLTHTGEKPFKCPDCPSAYKTKESLEYHARNHTREQLFSCDICQVTFPRLEILCSHERTHSQYHYVCPTCGRDLPDLNTYKTHNCENYVIEDPELVFLGI